MRLEKENKLRTREERFVNFLRENFACFSQRKCPQIIRGKKNGTGFLKNALYDKLNRDQNLYCVITEFVWLKLLKFYCITLLRLEAAYDSLFFVSTGIIYLSKKLKTCR